MHEKSIEFHISNLYKEIDTGLAKLRDEIKHLKHRNKSLSGSNTRLKAIVKRLKQYEPEQTFYDTGEAYKDSEVDKK